MQEIRKETNSEIGVAGHDESQRTFRQLVNEIRDGSEDAAWELTNRYSPHILRIVQWSLPKAIRSKVDSQDLLYSVWATLLLEPEKLLMFENPQNFMGYIAGIAKHKVLDKHRHYTTKKRDVRMEVRTSQSGNTEALPRGQAEPSVLHTVTNDPSPSQTLMVREKWQRVLDRGSERDRSIVELRLKGNSYQEIATQLGIAERTIQRSVSRMVSEFQE